MKNRKKQTNKQKSKNKTNKQNKTKQNKNKKQKQREHKTFPIPGGGPLPEISPWVWVMTENNKIKHW